MTKTYGIYVLSYLKQDKDEINYLIANIGIKNKSEIFDRHSKTGLCPFGIKKFFSAATPYINKELVNEEVGELTKKIKAEKLPFDDGVSWLGGRRFTWDELIKCRPRILIYEHDFYGSTYYDISTQELRHEVSLRVLKRALYKIDMPQMPEEIELKDINALPIESVARKHLQEKYELQGRQIRIYKNKSKDLELVKKAIGSKDGQLAWHLINNLLDSSLYELLDIIKQEPLKKVSV